MPGRRGPSAGRRSGEHGASWSVRWNVAAERELTELDAPGEVVAVLHAVEKLEAQGVQLRFPHQSAIRGSAQPLRELRPRGGRSPVRAIYSQTGTDEFTVLAIGPDAKVSKRRFDGAVRRAEGRIS